MHAVHTGSVCRLPVHDLDLVHRSNDGSKRQESAGQARVAELTAGETWRVESVQRRLLEVALMRATMLVRPTCPGTNGETDCWREDSDAESPA